MNRVKACALALLFIAGCASWPSLTGTESLDRLRDAEDQNPEMLGGKGNSAGDCWLNRDEQACRWLSAFWKADYENAAHLCESSPKQKLARPFLIKYPCQLAAAYALGCDTVRGAPSGAHDEPEGFNHANHGVGPTCTSPDPYPANMIHAPEIDVAKAVGFLVTGCRLGAPDDCSMMVHILLAGLVSGVPIPQDIPLAHTFFLRFAALNYPNDKPAEVEEMWTGIWAEHALAESPEEREARVKMVVDFYDRGARFNADLAGQMAASKANNSMLNSIAAGLSAGMATNAAVNQNLAGAQAGINASVAASTKGKGASKVKTAANVAAIDGQGQQTAPVPGKKGQDPEQAANATAKNLKKQPLASDNQQAYLQCIQTNWNCEQGSSANCRPSVPPAGPYSGGAKFSEALLALHSCEGPWTPGCLTKVLSYVPADLVSNFSQKLKKLGERWRALPSQFQSQCPWPDSTAMNAGELSDTRRWCDTTRETCEKTLTNAVSTLQNGDLLEECVYYASFSAGRLKIARARIDQCSASSGYTPLAEEIEKEEFTPPIPSPGYNGPPKAPPPATR